MHFSTVITAAAVFAPLANAHGPPGVPKVMGLEAKDLTRVFDRLESRSLLSTNTHDHAGLGARQDSPKECGEGIGNCPDDKCCSLAGFCGTSKDHCYSPGCQYKFGPACPENIVPNGKSTAGISRAKLGDVPYGGSGIYKCKKPGTVALTYDDGPMKDFTANILNIFKSYNAKATFFVTGNNVGKGQIDTTDEYVSVIKRMDAEGHQIGSHTWTHLDLSKITSEERKRQIINNEMALQNIVGKIPTYLRPPYSSCDGACQKDMEDLGYHLAYFDVDTDDYNQLPLNQVQNSKDWFKGNITKNNASPEKNDWLTISHDILEQTANNLTEYMLSTLTQLGYKAVTIGECLNDPENNWYRKADSASGTSERKNTKVDSAQSGSASKPVASVAEDNDNSNSAAPETKTTSAAAGAFAPGVATAASLFGVFLGVALML